LIKAGLLSIPWTKSPVFIPFHSRSEHLYRHHFRKSWIIVHSTDKKRNNHFILFVPPIQRLRIQFSTDLYGCLGGTNYRYGSNDVINYKKNMDNHFDHFPVCTINSTPPHNLASNSSPTNMVVMVAQTVVLVRLTS